MVEENMLGEGVVLDVLGCDYSSVKGFRFACVGVVGGFADGLCLCVVVCERVASCRLLLGLGCRVWFGWVWVLDGSGVGLLT